MDKKKLIEDSLSWLDKNEPKWDLDEPIDRKAFIKELLDRQLINEVK